MNTGTNKLSSVAFENLFLVQTTLNVGNVPSSILKVQIVTTGCLGGLFLLRLLRDD